MLGDVSEVPGRTRSEVGGAVGVRTWLSEQGIGLRMILDVGTHREKDERFSPSHHRAGLDGIAGKTQAARAFDLNAWLSAVNWRNASDLLG